MSGTGGHRRQSVEDRFYSPPAMRKEKQQSKLSRERSKSSTVESEKRVESDDCASSTTTTTITTTATSPSPRVGNLTNLDRFLEHTTPIVPAQHFPKTSMRGWRTQYDEFHPFFILGDLWEAFKEWSAYGAGVPLVLHESDFVVQYYVPYLSGIQLYIDPSRPQMRLRRPGEESDYESSRESSDGSSDGAASRVTNGVQGGSAIDENEISHPPGLLIFGYLEQDPPFNREPLADKISVLSSQFPEIKTFRSCDLSPASWVSIAWYPIYRIPTGPTLQNVEGCFLTFHSLSTPFGSTSFDWPHPYGSTVREAQNNDMSSNLTIPIFGLASYKFKVSVWNSNGAYECQKVNSLLHAADNWLHLLHVNHPDYMFFMSHNSYCR